jgi:hypothetical protein
MLSRPCLVVFCSLGIFVNTLAPTHAQPPGNGRDVVYEAARNKIGLLRYCRQASLLDPETADDAILTAENGLSAFPADAAPAARGYGDQAEDEGESGILGPNSKRDILAFARQFNTTPASLCEEWAAESLRSVKVQNVRRLEPVTVPAQVPSATYLPSPKPASFKPVAAAPAPAQSLSPARQEPPRSFPTTVDASPDCP